MKSIALDIKTQLTGWDHSSPFTVLVSGVPAGASLSAGTCCFDGCWELRPEELDGLRLTPTTDAETDIHLVVRTVSTEVYNGSDAEGVHTLRMRVEVPKRESLDFTVPGLHWVQGRLQEVPSH